MINTDGWDVVHAGEFRGLDPSMSRYDSVGAINQNRIDKSELFDASLDLPDLLCSVRSRIPGARPQLRRVLIGDFQGGQGSFPKSAGTNDQSRTALQKRRKFWMLGGSKVGGIPARRTPIWHRYATRPKLAN